MRITPGIVTPLAAVLVTLVVACSDARTTPTAPDVEPASGLLDDLLGGSEQLTVLRRSVPLPDDESVTRTIGPLGGVVTLPGAGLTLLFGPLAVQEPTAITLRAPAGYLVGYQFEPHGLEFEGPVIAIQDLTNTEAPLLSGLLGLGLRVGYFAGELGPVVPVVETLPVFPGGDGITGIFHLAHFSGYVVATD